MEQQEQPTVFIIDDDPAVADALALAIRAELYPCATYRSAEDFLTATPPAQPGCLILDNGLPGMSGLELQELMMERDYTMPILFLTGQGEIPIAVKAIKRGAEDFLEKPCSLAALLERITPLFDAPPVDVSFRSGGPRTGACDSDIDKVELTCREQEVLDHIMAGESNKVSARQLGISPRTVEAHRATIMRKLGVHSTAELMRLVFDQGITADRQTS